jgi:predicted RNA binding protein YcfA (HicA-like mRNA interferase family)
MPGKLRRLSGSDVVSILEGFGFVTVGQRGDHCKLRRVVDGEKQTCIVPLHRELDRGTVHVIFRQAANYIPIEELRPFFYSG